MLPAACTACLLPYRLCVNSDNVPRLQEFTARFTARFCELMHDVSEEVAAAGLRLLAVLVQQNIVAHKVRVVLVDCCARFARAPRLFAFLAFLEALACGLLAPWV